MHLLPQPTAEMLPLSAPSSSSRKVDKRCRSFSGMSITRIGSEDGDDDSEHTHICKKVSTDFAAARNLLVSPKHTTPLNLEDAFFNFLAEMPLPDGHDDRNNISSEMNNTSFFELDSFLKSSNLESESNTGGFWETMYIMEQETH